MSFYASQIAFLLPSFIVCLVGAILAMVRWTRHPQASGLALAGLGVLIANGVVMSAVSAWLSQSFPTSGWTTTQYSIYLGIVGAVRAVIAAAGVALLVVAVFVGRGNPAQAPVRGPLPELPEDRTVRSNPSPEIDTSFRERRLP